jgi:thiol-disulfide isomerase/thioredoxin
MPTASAASPLTADILKDHFDRAHTYADYVKTGTADQQKNWNDFFQSATLTDDQKQLLAGFTREMKVLVSSGVWCGDCVQQCPFLARFAEATDRIDLRFVDRDEHADLAEHLKICGGTRVPVAVFMAEDFEPVSYFGDRTLARYRAIAERNLGPSCPLPGAPVDQNERDATMQDWLDETERVHLVLRLSTRLRQKHND